MNLYQKTMALIAETGIRPPELAEATGLNKRWMYKLYKGEYEDPGVSKIEKIYNYLVETYPDAQPQSKAA